MYRVCGAEKGFSSDCNNGRKESTTKTSTTEDTEDTENLLWLDGDYYVAGFIDDESGAGRDDCGGAVFGDDGGAGITLAGTKFVAGVDSCLLFLAVELDWGLEREKPTELCSAWADEGVRPYTSLPYMGGGGFYYRAEAEGD